jgi:uncharacterized Zn finger protein
MTCPECGYQNTKATRHEIQLDAVWRLEVHVVHCFNCGWVTVQDWRLIDEDEQERTR